MAEALKIITKNRRAHRDFEILDRIEAGIVLRGTEVKSLRQGEVRLTDCFARIEDGQLILRGLHIPPYKQANRYNHDPDRPKRLLLHRREIIRLQSRMQEKGLTLIPLLLYFKRGFAKVELGTARGKRQYDKREAIRKRDAERDIRRISR